MDPSNLSKLKKALLVNDPPVQLGACKVVHALAGHGKEKEKEKKKIRRNRRRGKGMEGKGNGRENKM